MGSILKSLPAEYKTYPMDEKMLRFFDRILPAAHKARHSPVDALQQKILNTFLGWLIAAAIFLRIVLAILGDPGRGVLYTAIPFFIVLMALIFLLERYISYMAAGILFISFLVIGISTSDTPAQVMFGESLMYFIVPVVLAGLLLRPWAGYIVAGLVSLGITLMVIVQKMGVPNIPAFILFFLMALVIQVSTDRLHKAMQEEQKKSRALQESKEKYHRLIDHLPVGVVIMQADKVALINPTGAKLFGAASPQELVGQAVRDYIHPDFLDFLNERSIDAWAHNLKGEPFEEKILRINGSSVETESVIIPFIYEDEPSTLAVFSDITERNRARAVILRKNQRIQEMSRKLIEVQESEKHHLAAELHDDLGQSLTSLKLMLELAQRERTNAGRNERIAASQDLISGLINTVRNISLDLRPPMLDDFGLSSALGWLFERFQSQTGIAIQWEYSINNEERFQPVIETAVFRIIQEALTNIARHAGVKEAQVRIRSDANIHIEVTDQGAGFDPTRVLQDSAASTGLSGMQERVRLLGGSLEILSEIGRGACIKAEIPLEAVLA